MSAPPDYTNLWWAIPGVIGGMGIPYLDAERRMAGGGALEAYKDELVLLHREDVRAVVCLLNIPGDAPVFESAGFAFKCYPVENGQPPSIAQACDFVKVVMAWHAQNLPVAVFCQAGAGRTSTMIACYLIHLGKSAADAIRLMRAQEPSAVETPQQIKFLEEFERFYQPRT
jgi:atypical dual specificity phosphatase